MTFTGGLIPSPGWRPLVLLADNAGTGPGKHIGTIDTYKITYYNLVVGGGPGLRSYLSKDIIMMLYKDGWYYVGATGDHYQFKHPTKKGRVTVTHPQKDIPAGTVRSIFAQAGWPFPH